MLGVGGHQTVVGLIESYINSVRCHCVHAVAGTFLGEKR